MQTTPRRNRVHPLPGVTLTEATGPVNLSESAVQTLVCHALLCRLQGNQLQDALEYLLTASGLIPHEITLLPPANEVVGREVPVRIVGTRIASLPDVIDPTP